MVTQCRNNAIAILIAYGPEVRAFLHSGLAQELQRNSPVVLFAGSGESQALTDIQGMSVQPFPDAFEPQALQSIRSRLDRWHETWCSQMGRERWQHYLAPRRKSRALPVRLLARSKALLRMGQAYEQAYAHRLGTHPTWQRLFEEHGIGCLLSGSYSNVRCLPALQTAANLQIPQVVAANSWKDIYTKLRVPVAPNSLTVWSRSTARDLLAANPQLPPQCAVVTGSLHLAPFFHSAEPEARAAFCQRYGLDARRPFLCYSAAAPNAVVNEEALVETMMQMLQLTPEQERFQVLLRHNPMESGERFAELIGRYPDLKLQKPLWEWNPASDWCCALSNDVRLWRATVFHATANVSIASTVTLEFAAMGKPVVNLCLDLPEPLPKHKSNARFWEADFYQEMRSSGLATPVFSVAEFASALQSDALRQKSHVSHDFPNTPVQAVHTVVRHAMSHGSK